MSEVENRLAGNGGGDDILAAWAKLKEGEPTIRALDAAARLGITEAQLVAARIGDGVRALAGPFGPLVERLPELGTVTVLTRNPWAVHEKTGRFGNVSVMGPMGLVLNAEIDLRLFLNRWRYGYAVEEATRSGLRTSLQFFAADGPAIHKIYLTEGSDMKAFETLVADFGDSRADRTLHVAKPAAASPDPADEEIDVAKLHAGWDSLRDVHDFAALLRSVGAGRVQALRLAGPERARPVTPHAFRRALRAASEGGVPIMIFVGNPGAIQIHTGPVNTQRDVGPWFNVLDPGFNLHLREDGIDSAWVVTKPTADGPVTSLEIYDPEGMQIALMFGQRKPGQVERADWRALASNLAETGRA
jgi:putative hemin transport protein